MIPAHERLEPNDAPGSDLHLRLVEQLQLPALDCKMQVAREQGAPPDLPIELTVVEPVTIAALVLGAIQGHVRLHHEGLWRGHHNRERRYSDAGRYVHLLAVDAVARCERVSDLGREFPRRSIVNARQQDRELVTSEASDQIVLSDGTSETRRYLDEESVSHWVPERIVDVLETIEIEAEYGGWLVVTVPRPERVIETFKKGAAIGETRQRVGARKLGDFCVCGVELLGQSHIDGQNQHRGSEE